MFWKTQSLFETNSGKAAGFSRNYEGDQTVLRGAAPKDSLITSGTSCGRKIPAMLFHCMSDFGVQKFKRIQLRACLTKIQREASDSPDSLSIEGSDFPEGIAWRNCLAVNANSFLLKSRLWFLKPKVCNMTTNCPTVIPDRVPWVARVGEHLPAPAAGGRDRPH